MTPRAKLICLLMTGGIVLFGSVVSSAGVNAITGPMTSPTPWAAPPSLPLPAPSSPDCSQNMCKLTPQNSGQTFTVPIAYNLAETYPAGEPRPLSDNGQVVAGVGGFDGPGGPGTGPIEGATFVSVAPGTTNITQGTSGSAGFLIWKVVVIPTPCTATPCVLPPPGDDASFPPSPSQKIEVSAGQEIVGLFNGAAYGVSQDPGVVSVLRGTSPVGTVRFQAMSAGATDIWLSTAAPPTLQMPYQGPYGPYITTLRWHVFVGPPGPPAPAPGATRCARPCVLDITHLDLLVAPGQLVEVFLPSQLVARSDGSIVVPLPTPSSSPNQVTFKVGPNAGTGTISVGTMQVCPPPAPPPGGIPPPGYTPPTPSCSPGSLVFRVIQTWHLTVAASCSVPPQAPTALGESQTTPAIWLTWSDTSCAPVMAYAVYVYDTDGTTRLLEVASAPVALPPLAPGTDFTFTVTAWNANGWSHWSAWSRWIAVS